MEYKKYLDMITWDVPEKPQLTPVCVIACQLNPGVLDDQEHKIVWPGQIYVDDPMLVAVERPAMEAVLASIIEAIFVIMGKPNK